MHGEMSDAELLRGLPKDLAHDIKRAAYEAKVREMEAAHSKPHDPTVDDTPASEQKESST